MPPCDPVRHHRRSIRLQGYDYRQVGAYFVTVCTHGREPVFGAIADDAMHLNAYGQIVAEDWAWLADTFSYVDLDACIVMPNHVHGIIVIADAADDMRIEEGALRAGEGGSSTAPTQARLPLGRIVGAFKTMSTKHVNEWRETPGVTLWQRNYYEHIIRDDDDLQRIREYILTNPARWSEDSEYVATPS